VKETNREILLRGSDEVLMEASARRKSKAKTAICGENKD